MKPRQILKAEAKIALARKPITPLVIYLFITILSIFLSYALLNIESENLVISYVAEAIIIFFIQRPFDMGATVFLMNFIHNKDTSVGTIFDGYKYFFKILPLTLITFTMSLGQSYLLVQAIEENFSERYSVLFIIVSLLFIVVKIYLSMTYYIINDNPKNSGFKAMLESIKMMRGHIKNYIVLQLSFIPWFFGIIITYGALLVYLIPYMETTTLMFYYNIKNPVEFKIEIKEENENG